MIERGGVFAINILAEDQKGLGRHFGFKSGRKTDKMEGMDYTVGESGAPLLKDTAGYLDCRLYSSVEAGDHTIFVGEVVDSSVSGKRPLLYRHADFF